MHSHNNMTVHTISSWILGSPLGLLISASILCNFPLSRVSLCCKSTHKSYMYRWDLLKHRHMHTPGPGQSSTSIFVSNVLRRCSICRSFCWICLSFCSMCVCSTYRYSTHKQIQISIKLQLYSKKYVLCNWHALSYTFFSPAISCSSASSFSYVYTYKEQAITTIT